MTQELRRELARNRELVDSLRHQAGAATALSGADGGGSNASSDDSQREDIANKWSKLRRQLSEKKRALQESLESSHPGAFVGLPLQHFQVQVGHLVQAHVSHPVQVWLVIECRCIRSPSAGLVPKHYYERTL